jgi:5-methyltetrahydrofolate--homocysteine methyltransferase
MGCEMGGQANITHPEAVLDIHTRYAATNIDLLITNTLTMNRVNIESHHVDVDVRDVNLAGVRLAREAAKPGQFILGDMSSTGRMLKPYGPLSEEEATAAFEEHARLLEEGGVDGFIIETMFDLREAVCALKAVKNISTLPVITSIAFNTADKGGRTVMGNTAAECALALTEAGADVVGANCGSLDPSEIAFVVGLMREATSLPLVAQPNAGKGKLVDKELVFDMTPAAFAAGAKECVEAGARLVGGCCGTSPEHIAAMVALLGEELRAAR